jgi:hypothetical protein
MFGRSRQYFASNKHDGCEIRKCIISKHQTSIGKFSDKQFECIELNASFKNSSPFRVFFAGTK